MTYSPAEETIGQRIRRLREAAGLSQRELAGPGVSYSYVSLVEGGRRRPSIRALRVLARKLGTTPEYLETGVDVSDRELRELRLSEVELQLRLADDVGEAEQKLKALEAEAIEAGDARATTRARIGLGLAAAQRGAHAEAIALLEQVVKDESVVPERHIDVYFTLGHSYVTTKQIDKAIDLWRDCLAQLDPEGPDPTAYIRFATYLSYALSDRGDLAAAREAIEDALGHAGGEVDPYTRMRLHWSEARLAMIEGEYSNAQASLRRAIALLETTEDTIYLGRAHLLYSEMLLASGDAEEAGEHLDAAERLLGNRAEVHDQAWLLIERGKRAARLGNGDEAIRLGKEALEILGGDDPGFAGRAHWAIAEGLAASGATDEAVEHFREAERLLVSENRVSIQVLEAWGKALRQAGRHEEAFEVIERAIDRTRRVHAVT